MFQTEVYKIVSKKIFWIWLAALFLLLGFYFYVTFTQEAVCQVDGTKLTGLEAIKKDKEIAKQWEGPLTMEKLHQIVDTYGLALNEDPEEAGTRTGNWVSRYATDVLTDYPQGGPGAYRTPEELAWVEANLENQPYFAYMGGLENCLLQMSMLANLGILVLVVVAAAPVFAEEYSLNTSALLLTTVHGRKKDIAIKIAASLVITGILYVLINGLILSGYLALYGDSSLKAGASLVGQITGFEHLTTGQVYFLNFGWGLLGILMMTAITLFFSAKCSTPFLALIWSLVCLAAGFFMLNGLTKLVPVLLFKQIFYVLGKWSPLYLPLTFGWGQMNWEMPWKLIYVLAVMGVCLFAAQYYYRRNRE